MRRAGGICAATLAACGGAVSAGQPSGLDGGVEDAAVDPCIGSGARICAPSSGCPALSTSECPGAACAGSVSGEDGGVGVCWSDLSDRGDLPCSVCDDGAACVQRNGSLICVPVEVCARLWQLGVRDVCTYADKRPYDGRPLPDAPSTCPGGLSNRGLLCGRACGDCREWNARRCIGRSPDHPLGVCAWLSAIADPADPLTIPTCALVGRDYQTACPTLSPPIACGVFAAAPGGDESDARLHGLCLPTDDCLTIARVLPGGFDCFDSAGLRVAP